MPYKLRKAPKRDLYWVVAEDGKHMSKDPLPKETAEAQMKALYAAHDREHPTGAGMPKGNKNAGFVGLMIAKHHLKRGPTDYNTPQQTKNTPAQFDQDLINNPSKWIKENMYEHSTRIRGAMDKMKNIGKKNIVRSAVKKYVIAWKDRAIGAMGEIKPDEFKDFVQSFKRDGVEGVAYSAYNITGELMFLYLMRKYKNDCYVVYKKGRNYVSGIDITENGNPQQGTNVPDLVATLKDCMAINSPLIIIPLTLPRHQNMMIYRPTLNSIERFEPHGEYSAHLSKEQNDKLDANLKKFFQKKDFAPIFKRTGVPEFTYIKPQDLHSGDGFQTVEVKEKHKYNASSKKKVNYQGFCQMWAFFYLELSMKFPTLTGKEVMTKAFEALNAKDGTEKFLKHILAYVETHEKEFKKMMGRFSFERIKSGQKGRAKTAAIIEVNEYYAWYNEQIRKIILEKHARIAARGSGMECTCKDGKTDCCKGKYHKSLKGCGNIPARSVLYEIAKAAYADPPPEKIDTFTLVQATPTLKFYEHGDTMIVGIRGTIGSLVGEDWRANYSIGLNNLENSQRFKKDLQTIQQFQLKYPQSTYDYYGVGHSLGGAILDLFISKGFIKNGVSYNPAVQPRDWQGDIPNERIYDENDPLYRTMGKNVKSKVEVRRAKKPLPLWRQSVGYLSPLLSAANLAESSLAAHALTNFEGGRKKLKGGYSAQTASRFAAKIDEGNEMYQGAHLLSPDLLKTQIRAIYDSLPIEERGEIDRVFQNNSNNEFEDFVQFMQFFGSQASKDKLKLWILGDADTDEDESAEVSGHGRRRRQKRGKGMMDDFGFAPSSAPAVRSYAMTPEMEKQLTDSMNATQQQIIADRNAADAQRQKDADAEGMRTVWNTGSTITSALGDIVGQIPEIGKPLEMGLKGVSGLMSLGGGALSRAFSVQLKKAGLTPAEYLRKAKKAAKAHGYKNIAIDFANDDVHKLVVCDEKGKQHKFGRVGYNDFIILSKSSADNADKSRLRFHASHSKLKGNWRADPFSPNNLALRILW